MQLVTSLTLDASRLRNLLRLLGEGDVQQNPFDSVLVTPLFASPSTLKLIRTELKEKRGATVYFDSGGYYAQQNRIGFNELYRLLRDYYKNPDNQWADWYVLPDYVPTSVDPPAVVEEKVNYTITASKMFHAEMPPFIQECSIPVIQGHNFSQLNRCIAAYRELGSTYIGFGSFGTSGTNDNINVVDNNSAASIGYLVRKLKDKGIHLHTFGISTPPVIYAFQRLGVYSFDSMAWLRSAGYGKIFMPFTRAYNVSHRSTRNTALSQIEFEQLKLHTGHQCPFCEDFHRLRERFLYRSLHNLMAIMETIGPSHHWNVDTISSLIAWKSQRYYKMFSEVYVD